MNSEKRTCQNCKQQFVIEPEDFSFYEKMGVPAPILCPECRFRRRLAFRNEHTLYKRNCILCGRSIVTMYHPKSPYIVYCNDCWASDKWDPFSYGIDYDFRQSFFEQLGQLLRNVPKSATYSSGDVVPNINSEYANFASGNKDCYLVFNCGPGNENCAYSRGFDKSRDIFDVYFGDEMERIYEGVNVHKSAGVSWGQNVTDCVNSSFLLNCAACQDCFGCVNLRHKAQHFLNEPLTKDEYKKRVSAIIGSYKKTEEFKNKFEKFSLQFPRRATNNLKDVQCTGDYIFESKNCENCFEVSFGENVKHSFSTKYTKDCYDLLGHGRKAELILEGVGAGEGSRVIGSWWTQGSHGIEYSFAIRSSEYCFGCDGVKEGKYSILNKRYGEKEFKDIRAKIVAELKNKNAYGLFPPPELAFFAYNETIGQDYLPLTKKDVLVQGFRWAEDVHTTKGKETMKSEQISDHIKDVSDSILDEILVCVTCGRNYKLIRPELEFYRQMIIPVPRQCFNCRHIARIRKKGSFKLYDRTCALCKKKIKTNYAPDRPEVIYCDGCYQKEVI